MTTTFHLVPHTHWDREWYLPRAAFQARLVPVLDELLDQLERDPAARFVLDSQTVLVEDYLALRPENRTRVQAAVRRGALEVGPWYVLADLLIPDGESLIRNLLQGRRDASDLGRRMDVLYSPDAFGHPAVLPALAREFGLTVAVIRRGLGRPDGTDRDFYRWQADDGQAVLAYHLPAAGYEVAIGLLEPDGPELERHWARLRDALAARAATGQIAVFLGADHHPAPRDLAGLRNRLQALAPDDQVRVSGLTEFFAALPSEVAAPDLRGELRRSDGHTWVLQGVHGTRARLKRRHSAAELRLSRVAEPLAALAASGGGVDRRGYLRVAWRTLIQSQFHDTLCGSCCDQVAVEQEVRLDAVEALSGEIARGSLHELAGHDPDATPAEGDPSRLVLWNPCARDRSGIVTAELMFFRRDVLLGPPAGRTPRTGAGYRAFSLEDAAGEGVSVQVLRVGRGQERVDAMRHDPDQDEVDRVFVAFHAPVVSGLGLTPLTATPRVRSVPDEGLGVREDLLSNRWVVVRLAPDGTFTLEDRRTGEAYPGLCRVEDEPDRGDTYTYSPGGSRKRVRSGRVSRSIVARGPLIGAVATTWSLPSAGHGVIALRLLVALQADSPVVRLRLDVENHAIDHRLRARFPVGAGEEALAGAAFGVERRGVVAPARWRGMLEQPAPTAPAQRFVAAAEGSRGLVVLAPGFFEYEWTGDRDLIVTLLRAVGELSRGDLPERPGHAGWPMPTPLAQEQGPHTIDLAMAPVSEADLEGPDRLVRLWEDVFLPVQSVFLRRFGGGIPADDLGVTLEGDGLVLSAVKPADEGDGVVLRCYNMRSEAVECRWRFRRSIRDAALLRADETELAPLPIDREGHTVSFVAGPRRIVTVRVT